VARISDTKRQAIAADIRAGKPRNQIALEHGVSAGSVTNIAREFEISDAFDRSATKRATEAAVADLKAERAVTSRRFLVEANRQLDRLNEPYKVFGFGGRENSYNEHELPLPPAGETRNFMTAAAVAFDKHMAADKHDSDDQGLAAVDAWLRTMLGT
jgi:transposase-like protein